MVQISSRLRKAPSSDAADASSIYSKFQVAGCPIVVLLQRDERATRLRKAHGPRSSSHCRGLAKIDVNYVSRWNF